MDQDDHATGSNRHELANRIVTEMPRFGAWTTAINEFQTPYGRVGYRQLELLWAIRHNQLPDGATASATAQLFQIQPSVVTRVLAKLESHGFIVRTPDPADGRRMNIAITPLGTQLSEYVEGLYNQEVVDQLDLFSQDEIAQIADAVDLFATLGERLLNGRKAIITQQSKVLE